MNDDENFIHKYSVPFLSSKNYEDVCSGSEYDSEKQIFFCNRNIILDLLLNESKSFNGRYHCSFFSQRQEIVITYDSYQRTH